MAWLPMSDMTTKYANNIVQLSLHLKL